MPYKYMTRTFGIVSLFAGTYTFENCVY